METYPAISHFQWTLTDSPLLEVLGVFSNLGALKSIQIQFIIKLYVVLFPDFLKGSKLLDIYIYISP